MQFAVKYQIEENGETWGPNDVIVSNHPVAGGIHYIYIYIYILYTFHTYYVYYGEEIIW
jgi:N-methylhydantoinase B/oxoprolinase/acetone carboxylase alpha subunit